MVRSLQRDIGKQTAFESRPQEAFLLIVRTAAELRAEFEALFKSRGLSDSGYNVLRILRGAGDGGRSCSQIGEHLLVPGPDVTRLVDRLAKSGLVKRTRSTEDRRVVRITLTEQGRAVLADLDAPVMELHERQLAHLGEARLGELTHLLALARDREAGASPESASVSTSNSASEGAPS